MKFLVDRQEMNTYDQNTIEFFGVSSLVLMEKAAMGVAEEIQMRFPSKKTKILVLCGRGNNGGDGLAIARILSLSGYQIAIYLVYPELLGSKDFERQKQIAQMYQLNMVQPSIAEEFQVCVDGVFGVGLNKTLDNRVEQLFAFLNRQTLFRIAVDVPSGIDCSSGERVKEAFKADLTITFGFEKLGHYLFPAHENCNEIICKDIGITKESFLGVEPKVKALTQKEYSWLPKIEKDVHKGSCGKILLIAGSRNMAGAAYFSGAASLATGAGFLHIITVEEIREVIQTVLMQAVLHPIKTKEEFEKEFDLLQNWADVIVIGPGIGLGELAQSMVSIVCKKASCPVLFDGDALTILSCHMDWLTNAIPYQILTPHLVEMERLSKIPIAEIKAQFIQVAEKFAKEINVVLVMKDARTVITDYRNCYLNLSGNKGMATAGSGDVLTGCIATLVAQKVEPIKAAALGVFLHGQAGDYARKKYGFRSIGPKELIEGIALVLQEQEGDFSHEYKSN